MTAKQENSVRGTSKFLRTVFAEDMESCASILTAEAEILEGRDISENISTLVEALDAIRQGCGKLITELKAIKE